MVGTTVVPLNNLEEGARATVLALRGDRDFQHRIASMGLSVGCEVEVRHRHGSGDDSGSVVVRVGETRLMIGHGMAQKVMVRPVQTGDTQ